MFKSLTSLSFRVEFVKLLPGMGFQKPPNPQQEPLTLKLTFG